MAHIYIMGHIYIYYGPYIDFRSLLAFNIALANVSNYLQKTVSWAV